jgi:putative redox protein
MEVRVHGEQDPEPPWAFRRIHVTYRVRGRGLSSKAVEDAVRLSEEKYCSVSATVRGVAALTHTIELVEEEG